MKNLKFLMIVLLAMFGFIACDKDDCNHYDHSADLVGTWTCMDEDFAEALVISADGSVVSTRLFLNEYHENIKGKIVVENGDVNLTFEDGGNFKSHFDIIPGMAFTIFNEEGERLTYKYCANDLSEEIVGMWVCNDGPQNVENEIIIRTYDNNGKVSTTGLYTEDVNDKPTLDSEANYKVVGDLVFMEFPKDMADKTGITHNAERLIFTPKATALGDIMNFFFYLPMGDSYKESTISFLRIKQHLELPGMKYDYIKTFVSNVKGIDKDIDVMGYKFNFAKMDGMMLDKMLKTLLFTVEFPDANTIKYSCLYDRNAEPAVAEAPIAVDGNKMTIKISEEYPGLKDVDMYTFQDQDNTQMHMYMPTYSFINFFGNMQVIMMSQLGMIDATDAAAVQAIYDSIDAAVESINLSLVMTKASKAI